MQNVFRMRDGTLDRVYLRTCAIYRLLKHGLIGKAVAKELAARPFRNLSVRPGRERYLDSTIEIWARDVIKDMLP